MKKIEYTPIGTIYTPYDEREGMPIQPGGAAGVTGSVEIFAEYAAGLKDLDGFSHIILLYSFHQSNGYKLEVIPFLDTRPHGVFATRAPKRPNSIGLSIVRLNRIEDRVLHIENIDVLNQTPLLDIKPYVPAFDVQSDVRTGWLENTQTTAGSRRADDRFM